MDNGKVNILLVDDQPARLLSYEAVLAELGETLVSARSGEEALRRLMDDEFAVILLDVSMPGMDGFETAQMIHQHPRFENTPIIFVTGVHIDELDRLHGYRLGAIDYVQVPVIPDILRSKVSVLVELYRKRRSLAGENANLMQANLVLQTERAQEFEALSRTLAVANLQLSAAIEQLEAEVAERRRAEAQLQQLAEKLRVADRRKDEFLATLAHELRNPLAPIRSALGVMRSGDRTAEARTIEIIDRQVRQLVRLVDDLLDVSRITHGHIELKRQRMPLASLLAATAETLAPQLDAMGHRLTLTLPPESAIVDGDPQRLTQIFGNLLNNACKYTDAGGAIRMFAHVDGDEIVVSVTDNGVGIPSARLDDVFDLFVQIDTSLERAQGGLGIGLTLVRRLVDMHGGSVVAKSDGPGRGSCFEVHLPLAGPEARIAPVLEAPKTLATPAPRRVLVVDDNRDAAETLALLLKLGGHEVRALYDPLLALATFEAFRPQIAFLDVGMPKLNGLDLAVKIRASDAGSAVLLVALTGWGQDDDRRRSQEAGFDYHLVKPADPLDIETICREGVRRASA